MLRPPNPEDLNSIDMPIFTHTKTCQRVVLRNGEKIPASEEIRAVTQKADNVPPMDDDVHLYTIIGQEMNAWNLPLCLCTSITRASV